LACKNGSEDAQAAAAWSHVGLSALLLLVNPIISSLSDIHGRKPAILLALILSCIPALVFYLIIVRPDMNPAWYYVSIDVADFSLVMTKTTANSLLLHSSYVFYIYRLILRYQVA
jgi:MFS family permease